MVKPKLKSLYTVKNIYYNGWKDHLPSHTLFQAVNNEAVSLLRGILLPPVLAYKANIRKPDACC